MITFTVILALHAVMNAFGVRLVALLNDISVWWHIAVTALFVAFLAFKAPTHSLLQRSIPGSRQVVSRRGMAFCLASYWPNTRLLDLTHPLI